MPLHCPLKAQSTQRRQLLLAKGYVFTFTAKEYFFQAALLSSAITFCISWTAGEWTPLLGIYLPRNYHVFTFLWRSNKKSNPTLGLRWVSVQCATVGISDSSPVWEINPVLCHTAAVVSLPAIPQPRDLHGSPLTANFGLPKAVNFTNHPLLTWMLRVSGLSRHFRSFFVRLFNTYNEEQGLSACPFNFFSPPSSPRSFSINVKDACCSTLLLFTRVSGISSLYAASNFVRRTSQFDSHCYLMHLFSIRKRANDTLSFFLTIMMFNWLICAFIVETILLQYCCTSIVRKALLVVTTQGLGGSMKHHKFRTFLFTLWVLEYVRAFLYIPFVAQY